MQRFLLCLVVLLKIGNLMTESVGLKADNKMDMYLAANENSYFRDPSQLRTELANFQPAWDKLASRNLVRDESDLNNYKWYNIEAAGKSQVRPDLQSFKERKIFTING
uniref:Uncharacterized protein n=1 Tax=Trichogramma kaykai TaxID=54128 RepID=A0ABD2VRM8_9HYME